MKDLEAWKVPPGPHVGWTRSRLSLYCRLLLVSALLGFSSVLSGSLLLALPGQHPAAILLTPWLSPPGIIPEHPQSRQVSRGIPEISPRIPKYPQGRYPQLPPHFYQASPHIHKFFQMHPSTPTYPQISSGIPNAKYPQISSGIPTHHEIPLSIPKNHPVSSTTTIVFHFCRSLCRN